MLSSIACNALRQGKRLQLSYDGFLRVVDVYLVGTTKDGDVVMRVWQVRGDSKSGEGTGWKTMRLDETLRASMLDEKHSPIRREYKRRDPAMATIICQR